jgi:hypothetical protein
VYDYGSKAMGSVLSESSDVLRLLIPDEYASFMMLENHNVINEERLSLIHQYTKLLNAQNNASNVLFRNQPDARYFLSDILDMAQHNESVISFLCPIDSLKERKPIVKCIRKSDLHAIGFIVTKERSEKEVSLHPHIAEFIVTQSISYLQKILGVRLGGKSAFRMLGCELSDEETSCIIRDYSNARGTLREICTRFSGKISLSTRTYVGINNDKNFLPCSEIITTPPFSRGETVLFEL